MPKLIIDTDKMAEVIRAVDQPKRAEYLYLKLRDAHTGKGLEKWMQELPEHLEKLGNWAEASKKGASIGGYSPAFNTFWDAYPPRNGVRTGKANALKAWKKVKGLTEPELLEACLTALEWQKKTEGWTKENGTFIPMASTYLNGKRWEDEGSPDSVEWEEYTDMNGATRKRRKT